MKRLLADTNALYALASAPEVNHQLARKFAQAWRAEGGIILLTDTAFSETMTLTKARRGATAAIELGRRLRNSPLYEWTPLTNEDDARAWAIFQRYTDKEWSYVDCGLYALALRLQIPVFTFDHHFTQMPGLKRLPV